MAGNLTRINNNQISDASAGNAYVGVNATAKLQTYTVTSTLLANNLTYGSDLTVTGTVSLTKESYYNNVSVLTGNLKTAGHRLFVRGTLTINSGCSVNDDGNAANGAVGGSAFGATRGFLGGQAAAGAAGISVAGFVGPTTRTLAGYIQVSYSGSTFYIPYYS